MAEDTRDLVEKIYATVTDSAGWTPVLDRVADTLGVRGCIVFEMSGSGPNRRLWAPEHSSDYEAALLEQYIEHFKAYELEDQDTFEAHSLANDGIDLIEDDVLCGSDAQLYERPNVKQLMKYDICHRAAGLLNKDNRNRSRFSVQLRRGEGRLTERQRAQLGVVLPHIAKALDLGRPSQQLATMHAALLATMDRLRIGICILDRSFSVLVDNEEFRRQCDAHAALRVDATGRLQFADAAHRARLEALMSDCLSHGQHGARPRKEAIMVGGVEEPAALCLELAPLNHVAEMGSSAIDGAILYSLDTSQAMPFDLGPVQQVFGLTRAEAALTGLIGEGLTNAQIAERRERSIETVNVQVKSVLSKTRCANRTMLVRMLASFGTDYLKPLDE